MRTHLVGWGHIYSSMRTNIYKYVLVIYISMRMLSQLMNDPEVWRRGTTTSLLKGGASRCTGKLWGHIHSSTRKLRKDLEVWRRGATTSLLAGCVSRCSCRSGATFPPDSCARAECSTGLHVQVSVVVLLYESSSTKVPPDSRARHAGGSLCTFVLVKQYQSTNTDTWSAMWPQLSFFSVRASTSRRWLMRCCTTPESPKRT
jgi:hypothetical protein